MAIKTVEGLGGNYATPAGFNVKADGWSANFNIGTVETTGFIDAGYKTREPVILDMTGSASGTGQYDAASSAPIPATLVGATPALTAAQGAFTLTAKGGCTLGFTGNMTQVGLARPVAGKLSLSHNFESTGPITQAWDEA